MARPFVFNQSRLKDFCNCNRLYAWRYRENLDTSTPRAALEIGAAVHTALAAFHSGAVIDEACELAAKQLVTRAGPTTVYDRMTVSEAQEVAQRTLRGYFEHWGAKEELWAPLNQEIEFLVEIQPGWWALAFSPNVTAEALHALPHTGIWIRGRSDNLSFLKGALFLIDYKTAARMDPRDLLKYEMDVQLGCYIYGLSKQLTEDSLKENGPVIKVQGAIIDLLVKTIVPQYTREAFTRTDTEMSELESELIEYGTRMSGALDRVSAGEPWKIVFPRSTDHCFRYSTCVYRDLCTADTPARRLAYAKRNPDYVDEAAKELEEQWNKDRS